MFQNFHARCDGILGLVVVDASMRQVYVFLVRLGTVDAVSGFDLIPQLVLGDGAETARLCVDSGNKLGKVLWRLVGDWKGSQGQRRTLGRGHDY